MSAEFWAGYISGAAAIVIGNPLDLVKTRLQAGQSTVHATSAESLRGTFDRAGTLVRGATAPILGYGALNGILFYTYNRSLTLLNESPNTPSSLTKIWTAGALGGFATFLISAPTELIKCRAQVSSHHHSRTQNQSLSSLGIAKEIVLRDGFRGLYFGGTITSIRDAVGYGFYFWSYEICNRILTPSNKTMEEEDSQKMAAAKVLLAGGIAGVITWASIFPLDVIKTRVQTQSFTSSSSHVSPPSNPPLSSPTATTRLLPSPSSHSSTTPEKFNRAGALQIAKILYNTEGLKPFFRGLGICSVRAFIVNAVQWAVYEWMMKVLRKSSEPGAMEAHAVYLASNK
ncbi:mitochondrial carrier [Venturia nashicola]|uniref:Mitochondrial carrier n=1 Tax=Venturia nashicola TaxID=86259 RepID=A0A4Z1PC40_9PEZI|nr:mitochondrial carrier [Venturia nashicola]TLD35385.1 mitochondrial carrier [Venturia nashicola]